MELEEYLKQEGSVIDAVYYLQNYAEGWKDGHFEEKYDFRDCIDHNDHNPRYYQDSDKGQYLTSDNESSFGYNMASSLSIHNVFYNIYF